MQMILEKAKIIQKELVKETGLSRTDVLKICRENSINPLGVGKSRVGVLADDGTVIKMAWKKAGELANVIEFRLWNYASDELKELLAPSIDLIEEKVLLMECCVPLIPDTRFFYDYDIVGELSSHGIVDSAVNLGILNGNVVCYDYEMISPELYLSLFKELNIRI